MPASLHWRLSAIFLTTFGLFAVWSCRPARVVQAADSPPDSPNVTVYDPDPKHLWNRLHAALYVPLYGEPQNDPGELDPFLRQRDPYEKKGENYKRDVAALDRLINEKGDTLIAEPRKRALLQRDLWNLFDMVAPSRALFTPSMMDGDQRS